MLSGVEIVGMREFARKIRSADIELARQLRRGLKQIAQIVSTTARPTVPVRSGRLARSVRPTADARSAGVSMGSSAVPYAGFIEFGNNPYGGPGAVGRGDSVSRPLVRQGRYLRPAYERQQPRVHAEAVALIDAVADGLN